MSETGRVYPSREDTFDSFAEHVSRGKVSTYRDVGLDVVMGERGGAEFRDAFDDRVFINCHVNGGVYNLGHRNPAVIAAVERALGALDIGNHHLISGLRARLAERLSGTTDGALVGCIYAVAGGEATDLAIKVARGVTGRREIVSACGGYHGHTGLALAAGDEQYRAPFGDNLPGFRQVPFDDLAALDAAIGDDTAAVLLEPVPATLGMPIARPDYLPGVSELCRARGAKLIVDEVQTGLGRTGKIWCYQHVGITPDALITGKGLSGGIYPIAATLLSAELYRFFDERPFVHISTFGGAELGCVAALTVLDLIEAPEFLPRVNALAERFAAGLGGASFELRQCGLMMGLKFPVDGAGMMAAKLLYDAGIFAAYANNDRSVLQLLPPLCISDEQADHVIASIRRVLCP